MISLELKVHSARSPRHPRMLHYADDGEFMVAAKMMTRREQIPDPSCWATKKHIIKEQGNLQGFSTKPVGWFL